MQKWLAFGVTVVVMLVPVFIGSWLSGSRPSRYFAWGLYVVPVVVFSLYVIACAVFELVSAWRSVLVDLELVDV